MSNPYFKFKQFTVFHDRCAMKVGTDGVLLGAWADCRNATTILDIGTGSGLIALMLAQRSNAQIDALEIDKDACKQSLDNISKSPFKDRIHVIHADFSDFMTNKKYDLIVSNPPYFSNSLQAPDRQRNLARHDFALPLETLMSGSKALLNPGGKIALILPSDTTELVSRIALDNNLYVHQEVWVYSRSESPVKRILYEISDRKFILQISSLIIEKERHIYTDEFRKLTDPFYL